MTMFSMKPKFDLAAFLAEPAKPGASRKRKAFSSPPPEAPEEWKSEDSAASAAKEKKAP